MANAGSQYQIMLQAVIDDKQLKSQINKLSKKAKLNVGAGQANKEIKSVTGNIQNAIGKTLEWAAAVGLVYGAFNQLKQGVEFISDLNNSMNQIQMVSGMAADEVEKLAVEYNDLAKELKATTLEVSNGALEWVKQGKSAEDAIKLTTASIMLSKLAFIDSAQATERLTSIMNGYKFEVEDMIGVLDKLVAVDNESATSVDEIAEALSRSSTSARLAGVEFDDLVAYISTISSVTRTSASSIGESLKTLFARLQKLKLGQLDEMGASVSDVELVLQRFTDTTLFNAEGQFRDMNDVISDLSKEWENLGRIEQVAVAQAVGGIRQREKFLVLMDNFNDVLEYQSIEANAAGLAWERYQIRLESVEAASDLLRATWESLWMETLNPDTIKMVYSFATGILEVAEALGGLDSILTSVVIVLIALNAELIKTKWLSISESISTFIGLVRIAAVEVGLFTGLMETLNFVFAISPFGLLIAGLALLIPLFSKLGGIIKDAKDEVEDLAKIANQKLTRSFKDVDNSIKDTTEIVDTYRQHLEELRNEYEELTFWQKLFSDGLVGSSSDSVNSALIESANTYGEYIDALSKIEDTMSIAMGLSETMAISELEFDLIKQNQLTDFLHQAGVEANEAAEEVDRLHAEFLSMFKDLQSEMKTTSDIAKKSFDEGITYDDIVKLSEVYEDYLDLLEIEGGLVKLNTDKLEEYNLAKIDQMIATAEANEEDERAIDLLRNYRDQLDRAIPMSRDYTESFQQLLSAEQLATAGLGDLAYEMAYVSDQFKDGEISVESYFDFLNEQLEGLDFQETFGENQEAAEIFFAGFTQDATESLLYINSLFNAGEISIVDYTSRLTELGTMFDMLGDFALNFAEDNAQMGHQIANAQMGIAEGLEDIGKLQEINQLNLQIAFEQNMNNMQFGSELYNQYMRQLADATIKTGYTFTDLTGKAYTSADELYNYLTASESNFGIFADTTAKETAGAINQIVQAVGILLVGLGKEISNFDAEINFKVTKVGQFDWSALLPGNDPSNFFPGITIGITGGGESLAAIGSFVSAAGQAILDMPPIEFDAGVYEPIGNQITGDGGSGGWVSDYSDAFESLSESISDAESALEKLAKEAEDFGKAQIEALQDALDAYDKLIDKRKKLLDSMLKEKKYQDQLEDQQKDIATIKNELLELAFDDSEEATAKKHLLEEQLAALEDQLADFQFEHGVDQQIEALEADYDAFAELIASQIDAIGGIDADTAEQFRQLLLAALGFIPTEGIPASNYPPALSNEILNSIINGGMFGGSGGGSGGFSASTKPIDITNRAQPSYSNSSNYGGTNIDTLMEINVSGNLDEGVVPEIERIANMVISKLNDGMSLRGIKRRTDSYSV